MENENVRERFIRFLRYHNAYGSLVKYRGLKLDSLFTLVPERWLTSAFSWPDTEEGTTFWAELDSKWRQVLKDGDIIIETDFPTDGAPDWYRGKPVYCEFNDDKSFPEEYTKRGFGIFFGNSNGYRWKLMCGTESGDIKDFNGNLSSYDYARPATPAAQAKYFILKQVDGKEEKHELTAKQMEVLGLEE